MTVILICIAPIMYIISRFVGRNTTKLFSKRAEKVSDINGYTEEALTGFKTIKNFNSEQYFENNFKNKNESLKNVGIKSQFYSSLTNPSTRFVSNLAYIVVAISGIMIIKSTADAHFSIGNLTTFLVYTNVFTRPFNEITSIISEIQTAIASAKRIFDYLNEKEELQNSKIVQLDKIEGRVEFKNVYFSYINNKKFIEKFNELAKNKNIILFIDEIHTIVGAGGSGGSLDAANMLKPALSRGEIQCIGATTLDEYRQNIEKDGALERRFQKVLVEPTSFDETVEILNNIKSRYEDHHNVRYTDEAIKACVKLTTRYISDRALPDKAIDAMDEAGSRVHIANIHVPQVIEELERSVEEIKNKKKEAVKQQNFEVAAAFRDKERQLLAQLEQEKDNWQKELKENRVVVDEESVAEVVAMMTGVPVKRIAKTEGMKLLQMREELADSVVGQQEAIEKIVKAIHRNRAGLKDPNRPIGSFIFLGPTGVGKTQLAKVLAQYLFDTPDSLIRIDMSEYMEKFAVSRLVGAPPGYVGYEEGGQLTEKVRRKPYSVVLLDEIEKAHPDVFNILLQLLDDGQLTDSLGRRVDFKNTIVIMTSNIGSRQLKDFGRGIGFMAADKTNDNDYAKSVVQKALKSAFSPEFLNRIDDVIVFNPLSKEDIHKIIDIELKGLLKRVGELGYHIQVSDAAKEFLTEKGYDPQYGARPLKRAIQKYLEDELAEVIIKGDLPEGGTLYVDCDKENDKLKVKSKKLEAKS